MKIKIGLVGLGMIANAVHIPGVLEDERLEITAICDLNPDLLTEIGDRLDIPVEKRYLKYQDLISDDAVDLVDIATSNDAHYQIAVESVNQNKPYCIEKPITLNYDEAKSLSELTQSKQIKSMVCFSYRYKAAARYCKYLLETEKKIGKITHINAQYYQAWALPNANVDFVWRFEKSKTGSGALGDLGSHLLDLVQFMTGLDYQGVTAQLGTMYHQRKRLNSDEFAEVDVDDYANFLIDTDDEASISFEISRLAFGRGNYQKIEIYGTEGALIYKLDEQPDIDELQEIIVTEAGNYIKNLKIPEQFNKKQMSALADLMAEAGDGLSANIEAGLVNQYYLDQIINSSEQKKYIQL